MDPRQYPEERGDAPRLQTGMAFLAENPEAYGFVPDACPAATSELLVAVNGHGGAGGHIFPTYPVEAGGTDGLFDTLYGGLIHRTDENTRLLRATFGESDGLQEHPVARYCAALAETVAVQILNGGAKGASFEQTCLMLGNEIPPKLARLRDAICVDGFAERDPVFYTVSLGACRITSKGEGNYSLDIFSAGDFRVFLLDGDGLHPLWLADSAVLSPDSTSMPTGRSMSIHHPEPFAVMLLSDSACALNATEMRTLRENPGWIWRYRMRLEDQLLRLITACVREQEFGERATRFFTGRSRGRDSASGAMMILREGVSYEVFRSICGDRLSRLEDMISLLPEGYDPANLPRRTSRETVELEHLQGLLTRDPGLGDRVTEALRVCAVQKLRAGKDTDVAPPPDVPDYRRLSYGEVWEIYHRYDRENDADRERVEQNRRILRDNLMDHWIVLRPYLRRISDVPPSPAAERSYAACSDMNARLSKMLAARKKALSSLDALFSDNLAVLRAHGRDWLEGRAGDGCVTAWAERLTEELPLAVAPVLEGWRESTERYRSLLTAYTYERELLFRMDTGNDGFFAADWKGIFDGTLPDSRWDALLATLDTAEAYRGLMDSLCRVAKGTGALLARMESRGAERRMARDLAGRVDLQIAALRASAYEDPDWGESVVAVLEPARRREHRDVVRRWQESCELAARRAEAFESYSRSYGVYLRPEP